MIVTGVVTTTRVFVSTLLVSTLLLLVSSVPLLDDGIDDDNEVYRNSYYTYYFQ
jgi:hypothetical protein